MLVWAKSPMLFTSMLLLANASAGLRLLAGAGVQAGPVPFAGWLPNETEVGERLTPGPVVPVPLKLAVCGLPAALSATLRVPLRVPVAEIGSASWRARV